MNPYDSRLSSQSSLPVEEEIALQVVEDFYAILNVPRAATESEIKAAYKRLAMLFHPDRHDQQEKEAAQQKFHKIQTAYDVLSNANKRHIYDLYGESGLDIGSGWDVARPMAHDQLKEEYERRAKFNKEMEEAKRVLSTGEINIAVDATQIFKTQRKRSHGLGIFALAEKVEIAHAMVVHSWETKLSPERSLTFKGQVISKNGLGSGSGAIVLKQHFNEYTMESSISVGDNKQVGHKIIRHFGTDAYGVLNITANSVGELPTVTALFARKLAENTTGFISFTPDFFDLFGKSSSTMIGLINKDEDVHTELELHAGRNSEQIVLSQSRLIGKLKGRCELTIGTIDIAVSVMGEKSLDKSTRFGVGMEYGINRGVALKFRLSRMGQKLSIPIQLSEKGNFKLAMLTLVVPLASYYLIDKYWLTSVREKKKKERLKEMRESNAETLAKLKREAEQATILIRDSVARRLESGEQLIIISAVYGKLLPDLSGPKPLLHGESLSNHIKWITDFDPTNNNENHEYIDVTVAVQSLCLNGRLHIPNKQSKSSLIGFYDPCFGERKELRIVYQFNDRRHQVLVGDLDAVDLPSRGKILLK